MGRKKLYHERMVAAFPKGTFKAIDKALEKNEDRTEFLRDAVLLELGRRQVELRKKAPSSLAHGSGQ